MAPVRAGERTRRDFADLVTRAVVALSPPRRGGVPSPVRWGIAPVATLFVAAVQHAAFTDPSIAPFVFFFFAIVVSAGLGGRGPGLLSVLLSACAANWLFMSPSASWSIVRPAAIATGLFLLAGVLVALVCASFRTSLLRLDDTARELDRHEEQLRASEARLRDADRRKNEFLAVLSHELRNPLAPIRTSLYILARATPGGEQARRALAVIARQVHHATRLVDDLLDVTRIGRGKVRLQRERVDLGDLASRAVEDHREIFERNGVRLELRLAPEPVIVRGDAIRIGQILGNLLQNAVKFTPRGGVVALAIEQRDGSAVVTARDSGTGIPPDDLPRVFEPFVQAEKTLDRSAGGLGLGLALVKGLAELHGGSVAVESEGMGKGATFTVRLPLERRKAPRLTVVPGAGAPVPSRRVLVIEDNIDAAETLKEALELNDHVVDVALTGPDGIDSVRARVPDVVICDIGLPGMDGFHVARTIREDPALAGVALIALSGYAQPEDVDRARAAGFDLHLAKPLDMEELERAIAQVRGAHAAAAIARAATRAR